MTLRYKLRTLLIVLALGPAGCDAVYIEPIYTDGPVKTRELTNSLPENENAPLPKEIHSAP